MAIRYQGTTRPTTRSISARTRRSTSGGRLASSQAFSSGRSSSRTMSSMVGPPLRTCVVRSRQRAHQAVDRGRRRGRRPPGATRPRRRHLARAAAAGDRRGTGCRLRSGRLGRGMAPARRSGAGSAHHHGGIEHQHAVARRSAAGGRTGAAAGSALRPRSGCGGSRRGCPPSRDRRRRGRASEREVSAMRSSLPRRLSGPAGRSRSRRGRPTCPSPRCSRRSRHTAAPADAGRARSAVRSPRRPHRTR